MTPNGAERPSSIRQVDYIILYVEDLSASIEFYRDVLGLEFKFERNGYAEFATGNAKFGLYERGRLQELIGHRASGADGPGGAVLFLVDDVDAWESYLRGRGARVVAGATDRPWGHRTLHVEDPDGFVVELAREIPRADST